MRATGSLSLRDFYHRTSAFASSPRSSSCSRCFFSSRRSWRPPSTRSLEKDLFGVVAGIGYFSNIAMTAEPHDDVDARRVEASLVAGAPKSSSISVWPVMLCFVLRGRVRIALYRRQRRSGSDVSASVPALRGRRQLGTNWLRDRHTQRLDPRRVHARALCLRLPGPATSREGWRGSGRLPAALCDRILLRRLRKAAVRRPAHRVRDLLRHTDPRCARRALTAGSRALAQPGRLRRPHLVLALSMALPRVRDLWM